jgi:hypothetical protein
MIRPSCINARLEVADRPLFRMIRTNSRAVPIDVDAVEDRELGNELLRRIAAYDASQAGFTRR